MCFAGVVGNAVEVIPVSKCGRFTFCIGSSCSNGRHQPRNMFKASGWSLASQSDVRSPSGPGSFEGHRLEILWLGQGFHSSSFVPLAHRGSPEEAL